MAKTVTREGLVATQALLQRAHDYVESKGFDINAYKPNSSGRCCYIGSVRLAAGIDPQPGPDSDDAALGDGPELRLALKVLDSVVRRRLDPDRVEDIGTDYIPTERTGRYVENYGFQVHENVDEEIAENEEALRVFRKALTKVYKQLEKLDAI